MRLPYFLSTFRSRLLLLGLVVFAPVLGFLVYEVADHRAAAKAEAVRDIRTLVDTVHAEYQSVLGQGRQLGKLLAELGRIRQGRTADCTELLATIEALYAAFPSISVADRQGRIWCSSTPLQERVDISDRKYFRDAVERREFTISAPLLGRILKRPILVLATPVLEDDGTVAGVVNVVLDLGWVSDTLARFKFPPNSVIGIADGGGLVVARFPGPDGWIGASIRDTPLFRSVGGHDGVEGFEHAGPDGVSRISLAVRQPAPGGDHVFWASVPADAVYGPIHSAFAARLVILGLGALAIIFLAWRVGTSFFLDPLARLSRAAGRLGRGDLGARAGAGDASGEMGQLARTFDDMAEGIQRREEALRASEERFRLLAQYSRDGMWMIAPQPERIVYVSPAVERIWGRPADEFYRDPRLLIDSIHGDDRTGATGAWEDWLAGRASDYTAEYRVVRPDGSERWAHVAGAAIRDEAGGIRYVTGVAHDVTERKAYEERIRRFATHDELTNLPNRALLLDLIGQALPAARRSERRAAVLTLNVDRLKHVNDSLGHEAGDAVLRAVAARLTECLRPGDTVARLGGDDFAAFLPDLQRAEDAEGVGRKLLDALAPPFDAAGHKLSISASLGIAVYPDDGEDGAALLRNSDAAMHRAKKEGGRSVRFFAEKLAVRARERLELEQALGRALELEQLSLHYQPQIDARTGRMSGAEALLRWDRPGIGPVSPARFIPVAEETGLIVPIGEWVLREACTQMRRWGDEGLTPLRVGVNLSARQFWHGKLEPLVRAVLRESGLPPELLELEVTEGAVMRDAEETIATLGSLKALGVAISVDDFGTGYSSLAYLRRFPIDRLKIDRSFVKDMTDDPRAATLVQGIIGLAHGLGFRVVAEGVETAEQARFLRLFRCDELQGYFIARPLPAGEFRSLLQANRVWDPGQSDGG